MTFGGLDALFNPAKQHMEEEKLRLQSTREDIGDASGGKRIDLDSGRVRLGRRRKREGVSADEDADTQKDVDDAADALQGESEPTSESAATQRARARRRKAANG